MQEQHDILGWIRRTEDMLQDIQTSEHDHPHIAETAHRIGAIAGSIGEDLEALLGQFNHAERFRFHVVDDERASSVRVPYFAHAIPAIANADVLEVDTLKTEIIEFSQAVRRLLMTLNDEQIVTLHGVQDFLHHQTTIRFPEPAHSH